MSNGMYHIIRKIHLYCSLTIVVFLIMYILTSYMMIHHEWFETGTLSETSRTVKVNPEDISPDNWSDFLGSHEIGGRQYNDYTDSEGNMVVREDIPGSE